MNLRIKSKNIGLAASLLFLLGCGVKGDPLPPKQAPRLGRGHPTYTKASQQVTPEYEQNDEQLEKNKRKK